MNDKMFYSNQMTMDIIDNDEMTPGGTDIPDINEDDFEESKKIKAT